MPRLILHHGTSLVSRGIQFRDKLQHQNVWANHASIEVRPGELLIEATFDGVVGPGHAKARRLAAIDQRREQTRVFLLPPARSAQHERDAEERLRATIGLDYDFRSILSFVLPLHGVRGASDHYFCSELAKQYADWRGVAILGQLVAPPTPGELGEYIPPENVDPSDLLASPVLVEISLAAALRAA